MPRRFFKRLSRKRHELHNRWFMRPFRSMLANPQYWSVNRRNICKAVALGLFIAFIPLPVHIVGAAICALWLRVNIPVTLATIFVSNPFTMVPQYYLCYRVGSSILGAPPGDFAFEMSWQWIQNGLLPIWKPLVLGCLILGSSAAMIGYVVLSSLWHFTLVMKYHERKRRGTRSTGADHKKHGVRKTNRSAKD